jgi:hypothetical protein
MQDLVDMLHVWLDVAQFEHALPELPQALSVSLSAATQAPALQQPVQLLGPQLPIGIPHEGTIATRKPISAPKHHAFKFMRETPVGASGQAQA